MLEETIDYKSIRILQKDNWEIRRSIYTNIDSTEMFNLYYTNHKYNHKFINNKSK